MLKCSFWPFDLSSSCRWKTQQNSRDCLGQLSRSVSSLTHYNLTLLNLERKFDVEERQYSIVFVEKVKPTVSFEILLHITTHSTSRSSSTASVQSCRSWCLEGPQDAVVLSLPPCSSSPQHVEECCGWMRAKLNDLNKEQHHIVHQHQEQVSFTLTKHQAGSLLNGTWALSEMNG